MEKPPPTKQTLREQPGSEIAVSAQPKHGWFPRSRVRDLALLLAVATAYHWNVPMAVTGTCLVVLGIALQTWSKAALRRNRKLGSDGPYAICRHPFYLANFAFDLGLCVMSGNLWLVALYPLLFWIGYRPTIRYEEALLRQLFGKAHVAYCERTSPLLPSLVGVMRRWRSPCSYAVMLQERQVSRAIRLLALPLLVALAARTWKVPASLLSDPSLGLLLGTVTLTFAGHLVYRMVEKPLDLEPVPAIGSQRVVATAGTAS